MIRSLDMPGNKILEIHAYELEGPFGPKEAGEALTNPTADDTIGNAIYKAVGVRVNTLLINPEKIFKGLKEKEKRKKPRKKKK